MARQPLGLVCLAVFSALPAAAQDNTATLDFTVGAERSDNIARVADPALADAAGSETVWIGGLDFDIDSRSTSLVIDARGTLTRYTYSEGAFDDETLAAISGVASWYAANRKFRWFVSANHGQQTRDPLQPVTPLNRENVTFLSTGPTLSLPLNARNSIRVSAIYSDVDYEESLLSNQRGSATIGFVRTVSPSSSFSINATTMRIEYDLEELYVPYDMKEAYVGYEIGSGRTDLDLELGWNRYERADDDGDGYLVNLDLSRQMTPQSTLSLKLGSKYSNNGDIFRLGQDLQPQFDQTQDLEPVDDIFQYDVANIAYTLDRSRTRVRLQAGWSEEDYETRNDIDRSWWTINASVARDLTRALAIEIGGQYDERDYDTQDRQDDDTSVDVGVRVKLGTRTDVRLSARRMERDSSVSAQSYEENRYSLMFTVRALGAR